MDSSQSQCATVNSTRNNRTAHHQKPQTAACLCTFLQRQPTVCFHSLPLVLTKKFRVSDNSKLVSSWARAQVSNDPFITAEQREDNNRRLACSLYVAVFWNARLLSVSVPVRAFRCLESMSDCFWKEKKNCECKPRRRESEKVVSHGGSNGSTGGTELILLYWSFSGQLTLAKT